MPVLSDQHAHYLYVNSVGLQQSHAETSPEQNNSRSINSQQVEHKTICHRAHIGKRHGITLCGHAANRQRL